MKTTQDICPDCVRKEEKAFQKVYRFLSKRENREATIAEIVKATEVEEELIIKFIRTNRLQRSRFPKLAYPCENRSEEHTSELQSRGHLVCRLLLEKKKYINIY